MYYRVQVIIHKYFFYLKQITWLEYNVKNLYKILNNGQFLSNTVNFTHMKNIKNKR